MLLRTFLRSLSGLLAVLLVLTACGGGQTDAPQPTAAPTAVVEAAPTNPPAPQGLTVNIEIGDNTFTPAALSVAPNTTVIWTHTGQRPHTVTADDGSFSSGELRNGATFQFTFDQAATVAYFCEFHGGAGGQGMSAALTVGDQAVATGPQPVVVSGAGDITAVVEEYRNLLGQNNGGDPGHQTAGRREINWDGVPDEVAAPNNYPPDFFNAPQAPRARGIVLNTPGAAIQVSADSDNPSGALPRFGHINPTYADIFKAFSEERLFSPVGSNVVDATFFVAGKNIPALVRGFGAVYTDVDQDHTAFEYFDQQGNSLGKFPVPIADNGLSFLGVAFDQPIVARVRIEYGTVALGPNDDAANDAAVMDDFIFGEPQPVDPNALAAQPSAPAFTLDGNGSVNRDKTQAAQNASLAIGPSGSLWAMWAENVAGGLRQVLVSELAEGAFQPRGGALNLHLNVVADQSSLTFAGENRAVPWATWAEPSPGFGNVPQIFASRFNAGSGLWQPAGQDRGGSEPSLNLHTNREASHPFIAGGSGDPTRPPVPWVVWEELSGSSNFVQIFVAHGVQDDSALSGFRWEFVGQVRDNEEPTLNVDVARDALHPTMVFAETGNAVPWVAWHELSLDRPSRVFAARGVADPNTPGGFKWVYTPACAPDETVCSLNVNPLQDAKDATMTAGSLNPGEASVPWIAWVEIGPTGKWQIFVSTLDTTTRNSFSKVGGSLNVDQNHDARTPFITFVKNVPYVAWLEDDGTGKFNVQVHHLASDVQTGTWVLDTPPSGFNFDPARSDFGLFATSSADALFMAWTEGDPATEAAQIMVGHLTP